MRSAFTTRNAQPWSVGMQTPRKAKKISKGYVDYQRHGDIKILYKAFEELFLEMQKYIEIEKNFDTNKYETRVILKGWIDPRFSSKLKILLTIGKLRGADLTFKFGYRREDVAAVLGPSYLDSGYKIEFSSEISKKFVLFKPFLGFNYLPNPSSEMTKSLLDDCLPQSMYSSSQAPSLEDANLTIDSLYSVRVERSASNSGLKLFGLPPKMLALDVLMLENTEAIVAALRSFHFPEFARIAKDRVPVEYRDRLLFLSETLEVDEQVNESVVLGVNRLFEKSLSSTGAKTEMFPTVAYKKNVGHCKPGTLPVESDLVRITDLTNAFVQKGGTIICENRLVVVDRAADPRIEFVSGQWDHVFGSSVYGERALIKLCEPANESFKNGVLLSGRNDFNWYHWMIEYMPRAIEVDPVIDAKIPWVISNRVPKSGIDALKMISSREIVVCDSEKLHSFSTLKVMSPNASVIDTLLAPWEKISKFNLDNLRMLRKSLIGADTRPKFAPKVFIERASTHRNVINQDELIELAASYGFQSVSLEELDFSQQLNLFSNADAVITAGGAVMANFIFMKPGSNLVQLNNVANKEFIIPALLCDVSQTKLTTVVGRPAKEKGASGMHIDIIHGSYEIRPKDLRSALNSLALR